MQRFLLTVALSLFGTMSVAQNPVPPGQVPPQPMAPAVTTPAPETPAVKPDKPEPPPKSIPVRKIKIEGVTWPIGRPQEPLIINSQKKLAEVFDDEASQAAVLKLLNLEKERLVVFHWQGSGGDKLELVSANAEEQILTTFVYRRGLTRDLRPHLHLYVVPQDAKFNVQIPQK
jgi:hypothetical protein